MNRTLLGEPISSFPFIPLYFIYMFFSINAPMAHCQLTIVNSGTLATKIPKHFMGWSSGKRGVSSNAGTF